MRWGLENATSLTSNFLLLNSDETEVSGLDPKISVSNLTFTLYDIALAPSSL